MRVFGSTESVEARRATGVVFQSISLDRHLTVAENLIDQARMYGMSRSEARRRVDEELDLAGLSDRRTALVKSLSGGLARRVDLCRALLHRPRLLLLDEPTVGLDPGARQSFLEQLERRRRDHDLTVVMTTHLVDEADRHERVVLIDHGAVVADDAPAALRRELGARCITVLDHDWRPRGPEAERWRRAGAGWTLELSGSPGQAAAIAGQLAGSGVPFSIAPPTLADVFERLTGHALDLDEGQVAEDDRPGVDQPPMEAPTSAATTEAKP
jgi:ABC-2 type transport system ATP-binding protein